MDRSQNNQGSGFGPIMDAAIGAIGGLVGGWLFSEIGLVGVIGFLLALAAAIVGAGISVLMPIFRILRPRMAAG